MIPRGVEIFVALDPIDLRWASIACVGWSPSGLAARRDPGRCSCSSGDVAPP